MAEGKEIVIPFDGIYWWSDSKNVTEPLKNVLDDILSETVIMSIDIHGYDFQDGRQSRNIVISIMDNKITVTKSY